MFFSKKAKKAQMTFLVCYSKVMKYQQLIVRLKSESKSQVLLYYFDKTRSELEELLSAAALPNINIINAHDFIFNPSDSFILVELHPLASVTNRLITKLPSDTAIECYMGIDEPIMKHFGSVRIISVLEKLGFQQNDVISHDLVSKSIEKAQIKLDQKISNPKDVKESMEKWAEENELDQMAL